MSPYEWLVDLYAKYQEAYGWTPKEIDEQDLLFLIEQLAIKAKIQEYKDIDYVLNKVMPM